MNSDEKNEIWLLFEQDGTRSFDEAEGHLLGLETDASSATDLNGLYRALHSLKGNARVMGLHRLEGITHKIEDLVGICRDRGVKLEGELFTVVLEACDILSGDFPNTVTHRSDISAEKVEGVSARLDSALGSLRSDDEQDAADDDEEGAVFDGGPAIDFDFDFDFDIDVTEPEPEMSVTSEDTAPKETADARPAAETSDASTKEAAGGQSSGDDTGTTRRDTLIQVRSSKIQELLSIASDLGLSTDSLLANPGIVALREESEDVTEQAHRLRRLMRDLRFSAASLALVPINELFAKVRRIARTLARSTGKQFEIVFDGEDTEIDKSLVDSLSDPVLHIVRNAIDHGIESPEDRAETTKRPKGCIHVSASYSGNEVLIVFSDDGRGIDPRVIERKAIDRGLIPVDHNLADDALQRLVFHPGFSTRDAVSELSGRGVGMDVVNESVKKLRGRVELMSTVGKGTSLSIYLPLTLAFADALVVEVGSFLYAVPLENVGRIFLPELGDWSHNSADGIEYVEVKSTTVPVVWLDGAERRSANDDARQPIVTVRSNAGEMALPVDVLRGTEQITMRPLDRFSAGHPAASSCGILSNGDIALTLDCERLMSFHAHGGAADVL